MADEDKGQAVEPLNTANNVVYMEDYQEPEHLLGDADVEEQLTKLQQKVNKAFENNNERADAQMDYWDVYNCKPNEHQRYAGESELYLPLVHNAINARRTRFTNQVFPQSKRHVECLSMDGVQPDHIMSILEHYILGVKLRTEILPALVVNGDVEGQYNIYLGWRTIERTIKRRIKLPINMATGEVKDPNNAEAILIEKVGDGIPSIELLHDADVVVSPPTSDTIDQAIADGGFVAIVRRATKERVESMADSGDLDPDAADELTSQMDDVANKIGRKNVKKKLVEDMGIKKDGKEVEFYEVWACLKLKAKVNKGSRKGKVQRRPKRVLCQSFIRADGVPLGCRENPYWNNRVPVLSVPVSKLGGSFKGESMIKFVADMQYAANDAVNIGMDSAMYSLNPIVMTDPEKNPKYSSMVLSMAAIWPTSPKDTQVVSFPDLWEKGFAIAQIARSSILETLAVSAAAVTQTNPKKKPSQAEMANEQAVDILTTADAVTVLEEGILTPLLEWFVDLDYQYRDRQLIVKKYGPMGVEANMETIDPLQMNERFQFRWLGVEAARNAQQVQQQIGMANVLRTIPPQMYPGYKLDLSAAIAQLVENTFGPRLSQNIFKPIHDQIAVPPEQENTLLSQGFSCEPSPLDDHAKHLQTHMQYMQQAGPLGDEHGQLRAHIHKHMQAIQQAQALMQGQPQPNMAQTGQGGKTGQPKPGALPMRTPTGGQNPPGAVPNQQMNTARGGRMPRGNAA